MSEAELLQFQLFCNPVKGTPMCFEFLEISVLCSG